jgi:hypothetical protein
MKTSTKINPTSSPRIATANGSTGVSLLR